MASNPLTTGRNEKGKNRKVEFSCHMYGFSSVTEEKTLSVLCLFLFLGQTKSLVFPSCRVCGIV